MTEYAPRDSRGFLASLPFTGIMLGAVAAALVYFLALARIENFAETWLWRIPFLLSVAIIAVAIWMRLSLKESAEFAKLEAQKQITKRPLANILANSKRNVLLVIGLRMA
jgi:MFS transporter, MHS family, metabolite:H+ symporter